ncbi:MAG: hypothetical protein JKY80_01585 [Mariprofundaceae bacterium]|nr:hypothetical protein [Mariprofundaceae bacterium]
MNQVLTELQPIAAYNEFRSQLAELRASNSTAVFDYEDPKGNKDARSHVFQLRKTRTAIDKARKKEKESSLEYGRQVDKEAKEIMSEVEQMIEVHNVPLKAIEAKEAERKKEIESKFDMIISIGLVEIGESITDIKDSIEKLSRLTPDDSFDEFMAEATREHKKSKESLNAALVSAIKVEAEKAELQKLRDEQVTRDRLERDKRIAEDARKTAEKKAEYARIESERKLEAERQAVKKAQDDAEQKAKNDRLEAERKIEAQRIAAKESQERAELEKQNAIKREETLKLEAEAAKKRHAMEQKQAVIDAEKRVKREAEEKQSAENAEIKKREANKKHKAKINNRAVDCMVAGGINKDIAKELVMLIANKRIDNVSISY